MEMEEKHQQKKLKINAAGIVPDKHQIIVYVGRCWSVVTDAAVLLICTIIAYMALLYLSKISWNLYLSTHTGQMFAAYFPEEAAGTSQFLQLDLLALSVWITAYSFVISIAAGSICRLFSLTGYLYDSFGILGKTIVCGLPLTALVSFYVQHTYDLPVWDTTFVIVLPPTLSVYNRCFNYARKLLPDLGDAKKLINRAP